MNKRPAIFLLGLLLLGDLALISFLSFSNVINGWDESKYVVNAYAFSGDALGVFYWTAAPFLSVLIALLGKHAAFINIVFHAASSLLIFAILKKITDLRLALAGVVLFIVSDRVLIYAVEQLTELPTIFLILLSYYFFLERKIPALSLTIAAAFFMRWNMFLLWPAYTIGLLWQRQRRESLKLTRLYILFISSFSIFCWFYHGDPLFVLKAVWQDANNPDDLNTILNPFSFYLKYWELSVGVPLTAVLLLAVICYGGELWRKVDHPARVLMIIIAVNVAALFFVGAKEARYLTVVIPLIILVCLKFFYDMNIQSKLSFAVFFAVILVSLVKGQFLSQALTAQKEFSYAPIFTNAAIGREVARLPSDQPIYTDMFWLPIMANLKHKMVKVITPQTKDRDYQMVDKGLPGIKEIPDDSLFLTEFPPTDFKILVIIDGQFYLTKKGS